MINFNKDLDKRSIIFILVCFALCVSIIVLYFTSVKNQKENLKELNEHLENIKEQRLDMVNQSDNLDDNKNEHDIIYDNKAYDNFYNSLVDFSRRYDIEYLSLENHYSENSNENAYSLIVDGIIHLKNINELCLIRPILSDKLINFEYDLDNNQVKFSRVFIFDKPYSQKNLEIDNRESNNENSNQDEYSNQTDRKEDDTNDDLSDEIEEKNKYISKSIFSLKDKINYDDFIPMNENLFLDFKTQTVPIINKEGIVINVVNNSNKIATALLDLSSLNLKFYTGDLKIYIENFMFDDSSISKKLYCIDFGGTEYNISGNQIDDKTYFNIDKNMQFPVKILGIKFEIQEGMSSTMALFNIGYHIDKKQFNNFNKNGSFCTIIKNKDISIDDFLSEIGGKINKKEFMNDNFIDENNFINKKILLVRFREVYDIK